MFTFSYQKASVSYIKEGNGFPVVFIHGFAEDSHVWKYQLSFLQQYCTVIIPDLPGSGHSELLQKKENEKHVLISDYADCIHALLQHLHINKCAVFGHSMGGYITLALAEKYPYIINSFGFVHSTAFADSDEKKNMRAKGINTIEQYGSYAFIKSTTPNLFSKKYKAEHPDEIDALIERGKTFSIDALQQYYTAMMLREDKTSVLRNSTVPVLFVMGKEDVAAPVADVLQQAHLPHISYIHVLKDVGHMGMWEDVDEVNKCLLEFVQDIT